MTAWYKDWFLIAERQHDGSILITASNDSERFKKVFYFYTMRQALSLVREIIRG